MNILVIAPHPDDEVIGVGGTIAKRVKNGDQVWVCVVTKGFPPLFSEESVNKTRQECCLADHLLGVKETFFLDFPAARLEEVSRIELNSKILQIINEVKPDEVFIPHIGDMQIDHQLVVSSSMVALRPKYSHIVKRIYSYETLSETGWNVPNAINEFIPNVYEDVSDYIDLKLKAMKIFESQLDKFPATRSIDSIEALSKYRGSMVYKKSAEAFCLIREIK